MHAPVVELVIHTGFKILRPEADAMGLEVRVLSGVQSLPEKREAFFYLWANLVKRK